MKFVIRGVVLVGVGYGVGYVHGMKAGVNTSRVLEEMGRGMQLLAKEMAFEKEQRQESVNNTVTGSVQQPTAEEAVVLEHQS